MPWKNGGGTTRALAEDVDAQGTVLWRLSLADIDRDGPFSVFPGMQRHHVIVRGAGLTLDARDLQITACPFSVVDFGGDTPFQARLTDGPCQAVNLIYDPRHIAASMDVVTHGTWHATGMHSLILCLEGAATLDVPQGQVHAGQATWVRGSARLRATEAAQLVCFQITDLQ